VASSDQYYCIIILYNIIVAPFRHFKINSMSPNDEISNILINNIV